jgi:CubicO group peptidase (beta-lactamase class C family)
MMFARRACVAATLLLLPVLLWPAAHADAPGIERADDVANFGPIDNIMFWSVPQKVAGFRNMPRLTPTRSIAAGSNAYPLPCKITDMSAFSFSYDDAEISLDEYVRRNKVAGLLIIKDGFIVYERYELGNSPESRWMSWSVAKSVTSLLVGAAIRDGYIESVDEKISDYLPRLKNSAYDDVSIRQLLHMSSGVAWNEDYADPASDINTIKWDTLSVYDQLREKSRVAAAGEIFSYNTAETNLVGTLLRAAIGNNLSTYLSHKIWQPFGMEYDGSWNLTEQGGGEFGGSSLNATLRDYARIGLFVLNNGQLRDGTRVLPENWIAESTTPSAAMAGYGYLWWLRGDEAFAASGIFGQAIHIDPVHNIVIAQHAAREAASAPDDWAMQLALFRAISIHFAD